ncbi:MAG TPA: hypothetical protein PK821_03590, partial [Victivallales bacterium]|nr:hypothetical protein [Victivallales bacterium]
MSLSGENRDNVFPLDIAGVEKIGIENWFSNYSEPVLSSLFYDAREKLTNCFSELMPDTESNPDLRNVWLANYKRIFQLSDLYFKYVTLNAAKGKGYETALLSGSEIDISSAQDECKRILISDSRIVPRPFAKRIVDRFRALRKNHFDPSSFYPGFNDCHKNYIVGSPDREEIKFFLEENNIRPYSINPGLLSNGKEKQLNKKQLQATKSLLASFFTKIFNSLPESEEAFDESVRKIILDGILNSYQWYLSILSSISKYDLSGKDLIICPIGN